MIVILQCWFEFELKRWYKKDRIEQEEEEETEATLF
jgi:hypothetical protein